MKKINKIINALIIVSFIALSICSFNGKVYAENQTGNANTASSNSSGNSSTSNTTGNTVENKTSTNTQTNTTSTSNDSNTKTTTSTKSNNANLSNLGIKPNDFKGFKAQTTTYNVTLAKGKFILFVDTRKLSVGVNCFPVNSETLETQ